MQVECMEPVHEPARPLIMPGDDEQGRLVVTDDRCAENPPLRIVRTPHIDNFRARPWQAKPGGPQGHRSTVRPSILLVSVVDVDRIVHGRDDDGIEGAFDGWYAWGSGRIDR